MQIQAHSDVIYGSIWTQTTQVSIPSKQNKTKQNQVQKQKKKFEFT